MKSLQLSDYKGIIQYLGFERKMMSDIDTVCKDGHHKSKKRYVKRMVREVGVIIFKGKRRNKEQPLRYYTGCNQQGLYGASLCPPS